MEHNVKSGLQTYNDADWVYQVEDVGSGVHLFWISNWSSTIYFSSITERKLCVQTA
jgi:hypothetical protein